MSKDFLDMFSSEAVLDDALSFRRFALKKYVGKVIPLVGYLTRSTSVGPDNIMRHTVINIQHLESSEYLTDHAQVDFWVKYYEDDGSYVERYEFSESDVDKMIIFQAEVDQYGDYKYGLRLVKPAMYIDDCKFSNYGNLVPRAYDYNKIIPKVNERINTMTETDMIHFIIHLLKYVDNRTSTPDKFVYNYFLNTLTLNTKIVNISVFNTDDLFKKFDMSILRNIMLSLVRLVYITYTNKNMSICDLMKIVTILVMGAQYVDVVKVNKANVKIKRSKEFLHFMNSLGIENTTLYIADQMIFDHMKDFDITNVSNDELANKMLNDLTTFTLKQIIFDHLYL